MKPCLAAALALALAAPLPLAAQDLVFDMSATDACFAGGGWEECIGRSADACMEQSAGGYSTYAMVGCMDLEWQEWDQALNRAFSDLVDAARAEDLAAGQGTMWEDGLRDMQRAWIGFRDATCAYETLEMHGGTGASLIATGCLMRMTGEQALYLQSLLAAG